MSDNQESLSVDQAVNSLLADSNGGSQVEEKEEIVSKDNQASEVENDVTETAPFESEETDTNDDLDNQDEDQETDFVNQEEVDDDQDYVELPDGDKITLQELLDGYERQSDYTRKTQAVAEQRKEIEAKQGEISAKLEAFDNKTQELNSLMEYLLGEDKKAEIDLVELANEDPAEFVRQQALNQAKQAKRDEAKAKIEEASKLLQEEQSAQYSKYLEGEVEQLYSKIPSWRDDTVRNASQQKILKAASEKYGFSQDELQISDHRLWLLLKDAMTGSDIQAKKPAIQKKIAKAPKLLKASGKKPQSLVKAEDIQKRKAGLKGKTGRDAIQHAAALLQEMGAK